MIIDVIGYNPKKIVDKMNQKQKIHKGITTPARQLVTGIAFLRRLVKIPSKSTTKMIDNQKIIKNPLFPTS